MLDSGTVQAARQARAIFGIVMDAGVESEQDTNKPAWRGLFCYHAPPMRARVAELVDALDLGSSVFDVRVRVSPLAPISILNQRLPRLLCRSQSKRATVSNAS
jgi:hypothetical protein